MLNKIRLEAYVTSLNIFNQVIIYLGLFYITSQGYWNNYITTQNI